MKRGFHPSPARDAAGFAVEQPEVFGFPVTYNPDDERFYLHAVGALDGSRVLGTFAGPRAWANLIQFAKRKRKDGDT